MRLLLCLLAGILQIAPLAVKWGEVVRIADRKEP
jgi:hypothetical protein